MKLQWQSDHGGDAGDLRMERGKWCSASITDLCKIMQSC